MGLTTYKKKRSFNETPEPTGGKAQKDELRFVIQKHAATRLHYDFRLEMRGVLKSWAVPKGPSLNPEDKRLAMQVEDHPYDYKDFEGIIPKGNYGAGTVIVWDEGVYEPLVESSSKALREKELIKELNAGSLKIKMYGKKLKGEFALVKLKNAENNAWLLIKHRDKYASEKEVTEKDKSVVSGKTLEKLASSSDPEIYQPRTKRPGNGKVINSSNKTATVSRAKTALSKDDDGKSHPASGSKPKTGSDNDKAGKTRLASAGKTKAGSTKKESDRSAKAATSSKESTGKKESSGKTNASTKTTHSKTISAAADKKKADALVKSGKKTSFPKTSSPMLATLVDEAFDEPGWTYEIKWDGYRAVARMNKKNIELISRNNKSFEDKFYPIFQAVKDWGLHAIVDGEIIVIGENGISNFGALQNWRSEADGELIYYVFDILWLDGYDLTGLPLIERREILRSHLPDSNLIRMSESFKTSATEFLEAAQKMGLEGIMAKKENSIYLPGDRTRDWLKIKTSQRHEVVIGGYTRNDGSSKAFSSLLVGVFTNGKLHYTGKIGTGFSDKLQQDMIRQFKPLIQKEPPFEETPDVNKPSRFRPNPPKAEAVWLKPELVCEVSYTEMTSDGVMRHPSFEGMREDKKAKDVVAEKAVPAELVKDDSTGDNNNSPTKKSNLTEKKLLTPASSTGRKTLLNPTDESQVRKISGHDIKFSHLSKLYWPKDKISKREMLNYYYQVAPFMLPYLKERPQSLNRHPNGIEGQSFYQKDVTGKVPDWIKTFPYHTEEDNRDKNFLVCTDEASLLYMASLGCIEINPWSSTVKKPDHPDWCIIDLDPDTGNSFNQVIEAAQSTRGVLERIGIESFCKTSGSTGLHIYIPLGAKYTYEESKEFARVIVHVVNGELPKFTSIERATAKRKGKIYLDFLQNRPQATLAAPYSVRPKPGATVSMPLYWDEVKKGLKMQDYTIRNAIALLKERGDLFKGVLGKGINMKQALKKMQELA